MFVINFQCPNCKNEDILEVVHADTTESLLSGTGNMVGGDFPTFDYERAVAGGDVRETQYNCNGCGAEIATDAEELMKWLREHGQLDEDEDAKRR